MVNSPSASMGGTRELSGLHDKETRHTGKYHETSHTLWTGRSVEGKRAENLKLCSENDKI